LLSCDSDYSLIELALLSDPDPVLYRDKCYCACLGHMYPPLGFQSRFHDRSRRGKNRRVCGAPTPVARGGFSVGDRSRGEHSVELDTVGLKRRIDYCASEIRRERGSLARRGPNKRIFGQHHSTFHQPRAVSSDGTVARPRIGRLSTPRSGDPHRPGDAHLRRLTPRSTNSYNIQRAKNRRFVDS
jgi:hypothetical protein